MMNGLRLEKLNQLKIFDPSEMDENDSDDDYQTDDF